MRLVPRGTISEQLELLTHNSELLQKMSNILVHENGIFDIVDNNTHSRPYRRSNPRSQPFSQNFECLKKRSFYKTSLQPKPLEESVENQKKSDNEWVFIE